MIYYIIGGHGSGKSTAIHDLMKQRARWKPEFVSGRRAPFGYSCGKVFVAGRYDIKNGGTDTIRPLSRMIATLRDWSRKGHLVIAEGVGQARFVDELTRVCKGEIAKVYALSTDLKTCTSSVRKRGHRLSPDGVKRSWVRSQNAAHELRNAGIEVQTYSRKMLTVKLREDTRHAISDSN